MKPVSLIERVIGEPVGRDTAAVGLAALLVEAEDENAAFALYLQDHVIEDGQAFVPFCRRPLRRLKSMIFGACRDLARFPFWLWLFAKGGEWMGLPHERSRRSFCGEARFGKSPVQYLDAGKLFLECGYVCLETFRSSCLCMLRACPGLDELKGTWRETGALKEAMRFIQAWKRFP